MKLGTLKTNDLLISTKLVLSQFSQRLLIQKNEYNQLVLFNSAQSNDVHGQAYLDFVLDPAANYVLQIKLQEQQQGKKYFMFGLMNDLDKDTTSGEYEMLCYSENNENKGLNTLVKGKSMQSVANSPVNRSLEVRINIQRRILKVGSLPNYDAVVEANRPETIDVAPYRFFLRGLQRGSKITFMKLQTVGQFDDSM